MYQATKTITAAGAQSFTWDGKDSAGKVVADEAYLYVIEATDGVTFVTYSPVPPTGAGTVSCSKDSYDPFKNDPMTVSYSVTQPGRVEDRHYLGEPDLHGREQPCPRNRELHL